MEGDAHLAYETFRKSLCVNPWSIMMWPRYMALKNMVNSSSLLPKKLQTKITDVTDVAVDSGKAGDDGPYQK